MRPLRSVSIWALAAILTSCAHGGANSALPPIQTSAIHTAALDSVSTAGASQYGSLVLQNNPLAYYTLADSGQTMHDSGSHHLDGAYGAGVRHGAQPLTSAGDRSAVFPGLAGGSNVPANTGTTTANPVFATAKTTLSVETWLELADYNRTNAFVPIVSYGRGGIGSVWALQLTPQSTLAMYVKVDGGSHVIKSVQLAPGQIYHVVGTLGGGQLRVYVNGTLATSAPAAGSLNYAGFPPQYGITIGGAAGSTSPIFNGTLNDVAVYASALSSSAVTAHYAQGRLAPRLVERPARSGAFVDSIGVVTHLRATGPYTQSFATLQRLLIASGIRHIGDALTTQPAWYVQEVNTLAAHGISASLIADPTQNTSAIRTAIAAFRSIDAIQGLNEPNLDGDAGWVAHTRSFQSMLYGAVKQSGNLTVTGPALTSIAADEALGNLSASLDVGAIHDYFAGYNPGTLGWGSLSAYGLYGSLSYNCGIASIVSGNRPLFATETGYGDSPHDSGGVDDRTLARYIPRLFLEHFLKGIARTTIYEFYDEYANGNFDDFGLVRTDNTPKSSYYAIASLIGALADSGSFAPTSLSYSLGGDAGNVHHLLLQKHDGTYELLLWVETPSYNPTTKSDVAVAPQSITLALAAKPSGATQATIQDDGRLKSAALAFSNTTATLAVDDRVTIVTFK